MTKYNDANRNGARDTGEAGLQGFVFTVKSGGTTVATLTSDANGTAASVTLSAGTYTVTETQQTGWTSTDPGTSLTKTVTVNTGQTTTVLFGNAQIKLPNTSTLEAPPTSPSPAMLFLLAVLIGQGLLLTLVFRRWRKD